MEVLHGTVDPHCRLARDCAAAAAHPAEAARGTGTGAAGNLRARVPCGTDHQYRLNPVLDEQAILTFEKRHNVRLPEDYRAFLLHVGNGGAGPYCGVLPLE